MTSKSSNKLFLFREHFDKKQVLKEYYDLKKKMKNLESSNISIISNSKDMVKNDHLANTVKNINKINFIEKSKEKKNSPLNENKLLKKSEFQTLSNNYNEKKRYNIYGILILK